MADSFDPDAYIAAAQQEKASVFDPDKYIAAATAQPSVAEQFSGDPTPSIQKFVESPTGKNINDFIQANIDQPIGGATPRIPQQTNPVLAAGAGLVNTLGATYDALRTPKNILLGIGSAAAPEIVRPAAGAGFATSAFSDIPGAVKEAFAPGTTFQRGIELGGRTLMDVMFGIAGIKFGGTPETPQAAALTIPDISREIAPQTAAANDALARLEQQAPVAETQALSQAKEEVPTTPSPEADIATKVGEQNAIESSTTQIQAGESPLGVETRPESNVPQPSDSDNVIREAQGTEARGQVPGTETERGQPGTQVKGDLWYSGVGPEGETTWVTSNLEKAKIYASRRGEGGRINVYTPDQVGESAFADKEGNLISPQEYAKTQSEDTTLQVPPQAEGKSLPAPVQTLDASGKPIGPSQETVEEQRPPGLTEPVPQPVSEPATTEGTTVPVQPKALEPANFEEKPGVATRPPELSPQALGIVHPAPGFINSIANYFTQNTPSQIWNTVKGSLDATLGKTFAKTTIADQTSGELGARWISSRIAAPHLADTFVAQVLDSTGVDPIKLGAALTEDNLRSVRAGLPPGEAANVTSIIGTKNSPFKTEDEYTRFLNDPATQQAIQRHTALWEQTIDPMFRQAQNLDPNEPLPSRGEQTGARINLFNDVENKGPNIIGTGPGNLTATFRKKSPFAIQARGTGQAYNIDYNDMMANTFGRQLNIASKNAFENQLVDSGNAIIGKIGENPTLPDGESTVAFPLARKATAILNDEGKPQSIPVNQNIYVRKSIAGEYRRGADVDLLKVPAVVKSVAGGLNRMALAGLTDASVHTMNLGTALFTRPSIVGNVLSDSLLSVFGRADIPVTIGKVIAKSFQDNKAQVAELAQIGAMRGEHPKTSGWNPLGKMGDFIQAADRSTRLVLDDTFGKMADAGLVENTETNRREFVNQVGQYNKRAQGDLRRLARDTGVGPFVTAGTTFNILGARTAALSPGVKATSPMAAGALRANVLSKWIGATVLTGTLNYLLTKDKGGGFAGRVGVPVGNVDTGLNDENNRPLSFPVFNAIGLGRAMRVTGAKGFIESQRKGLNLSTALDASVRDVVNSTISPFAGPVARFGFEATSGQQPAINVPRGTHVAAPGDSQAAQNIKDALLDANPVIKSINLARQPGGHISDAIRQQLPRLTLQPSQDAAFMEKYPEIVHKAQASAFIDDVVRRARNMSPQARTNFVNDSLGKLNEEDRAHATKTLQYRRILPKSSSGGSYRYKP